MNNIGMVIHYLSHKSKKSANSCGVLTKENREPTPPMRQVNAVSKIFFFQIFCCTCAETTPPQDWTECFAYFPEISGILYCV